MSVELETWAKRIGYVGAIAGGLVGAWHVVVKVAGVVRYYGALYRAMVETHEVLLANGGARGIVATLARLQPDLGKAVEELTSQLRGVRDQLALNEQRWRATHDDDPRGMFEADSSGAWVWANGTFLELVGGRDLDEVTGHGWLTCCVDSWRERAREEWERVVKQRSNFELTIEFNRPGHERGRLFLKLNACVLRGVNGAAMGWSGVVSRVATSSY